MLEIFKYMIHENPGIVIRMIFEIAAGVLIVLGVKYEDKLIEFEDRVLSCIGRRIRKRLINSKHFMAWLNDEKKTKVNIKPNLKWSKSYEQFKKN